MKKTYGDAFSFERIMHIYFYTSNIEKLLQAKAIFGRSGYELRHYVGKNEPYIEDYSQGTKALLAKAVAQVSSEFGLRSVFFVEDTSLRIEALSGATDFPGLAVKEWFSSTTFEELTKQLSIRGGDRRATVRSDIALHMPTLSRPLFFHGATSGVIAETPPVFQVNGQYPWLTPLTFNGWFIPNGASKRLGEMEFEESLSCDFRISSILSMLETIEALHAALNLPFQSYVRRHSYQQALPLFANLPDQRKKLLIVVGQKCSGKTTFGDYLAMSNQVAVFEASTILRGLAEEVGVVISGSQDANTFLEEMGRDCVARRIASYVNRSTADLSVVTGLRTVEEVLHLRSQFADSYVIFIDVDERTRFERHLRRARDMDVKTFKGFLALDEEQRRFGIMRVAHEICDRSVRNSNSLRDFQRKIEDALGIFGRRKQAVDLAESELSRSLKSLYLIGRAATCDEIAAGTTGLSRPVRRYNTNRALKSVPEFAERVERKGYVLRYRLTASGKSLVHLLSIGDPKQIKKYSSST